MPTTGLSENDERLTIETRDIDTDASMILANSPPTALTSPLVDTGIFSVFLVSYSPIYSGVDTEVEIKWVLSSDLLDGEMVTVTCPGLSNSLHPSRDSVAAMTYNIAGNMVADYFRSIEFDDGSDNFIFTVDYPSSSIAIPSFTEVHVLIALSNGITQATSGRDPVSDSTIIETISTNAAVRVHIRDQTPSYVFASQQ